MEQERTRRRRREVTGRTARTGRPVSRLCAVSVAVATLVAGSACRASVAGTGAASEGSEPSLTDVPAGPPQDGGKLVYAVEFDANTWTPFIDRWMQSGQIVAQAFYEPLAAFDSTGEVKPYLAQAITANADFTEWTITVRPGIRFHDGTPLDAAAVKANFDKHGAASGSNFSPLFGVASVDLVDASSVRVRTLAPWSSFPVQLTGQLGNQAGYMASPKVIEADDPKALPVGTGPFVADAWKPGERITGHRNPDYWREGLPRLDAIEFRFVASDANKVSMLQAGDIDALATAGGRADREIEGDARFAIVRQESDLIQRMVVLNTALPPLDDVRIRQALSFAIDRDALVQEAGGVGALKADNPFPPGSPWYSLTKPPGFDRARASALLADYQREHPGDVSIELSGWSSPEVVRIQQLVAEQWRAAGFGVTLTTADQKRVPVDIAVGRFQAAMFQKFGGLDPDTYSMFLNSAAINPIGAASLNLSRLADPELDAAIAEGRRSSGVDSRKPAYDKVQERMVEDLGMLWLYYEPAAVITAKRVHGVADATLPDGSRALPFVSGRHAFAEVWVEQ